MGTVPKTIPYEEFLELRREVARLQSSLNLALRIIAGLAGFSGDQLSVELFKEVSNKTSGTRIDILLPYKLKTEENNVKIVKKDIINSSPETTSLLNNPDCDSEKPISLPTSTNSFAKKKIVSNESSKKSKKNTSIRPVDLNTLLPRVHLFKQDLAKSSSDTTTSLVNNRKCDFKTSENPALLPTSTNSLTKRKAVSNESLQISQKKPLIRPVDLNTLLPSSPSTSSLLSKLSEIDLECIETNNLLDRLISNEVTIDVQTVDAGATIELSSISALQPSKQTNSETDLAGTTKSPPNTEKTEVKINKKMNLTVSKLSPSENKNQQIIKHYRKKKNIKPEVIDLEEVSEPSIKTTIVGNFREKIKNKIKAADCTWIMNNTKAHSSTNIPLTQ